MGTEPFTLESFRALHPWADEPVPGDSPMEWLWHFDLDVLPGELWRQLIDTSRFNRALGLSRIEFQERDGVLHGAGTNGGMRQEWVEVPWDWVAELFVISRRHYSRGFARFSRVIYQLQPIDDGRIRLWVYFGWIPRSWFGRLCVRIGMPSIERGYKQLFAELKASLKEHRSAPFRSVEAPPLDAETASRVEAIRTQLIDSGMPVYPVDRLIDHVSTGDDMDVYRIQVRRLANEWQIDDRELLLVALHATRHGLLEMSWDVICPHCRGVRDEAKTLGDVPERGACQVCEIDFETDRANSLEITFHVHSSVRDVPKLYFCSAEPSSKEHIAVQRKVAPGQVVELPTRLRVGRYRLRLRGEKRYHYLDVTEEAPAGSISWTSSGGVDTETSGECPGVRLTNDGDAQQTFVIERVEWKDQALRPVDLFNFQEFRDLFSQEYVATDVRLSVGEQTILFTDMVGSTRFYSERGDPEAFMEVKKHFTEVYEIVGRRHGAVVKTIGDAVMAAFNNPVEAVKASKEILDRFPEGRIDSPVRLRISLHTGPCIAVNLNSSIDYFGSTVNIAAKLQACAEAGEIAISAATLSAPGVAGYVEHERAELELLSYESEALNEPIVVHRWDTNAAAESSA